MVSLLATQPFPYAGVSLKAGQSFEASEKDANLLKLVGRAIDAPARRALPEILTVRVVTRELEPEDESARPDAVARPKRQYRRRDLTAEP